MKMNNLLISSHKNQNIKTKIEMMDLDDESLKSISGGEPSLTTKCTPDLVCEEPIIDC
jgi:hypothetical protein